MKLLLLAGLLAQGADDDHRKVYDAAADSVVAVRAMMAGQESSGSGVVLTADGLIATACSVVPEGAKNIRVWTKGPRRYPAEIVGVSKRDELTLLRIKPEGALKPIAFGESRRARVGDAVYTLGNASNSLINNDQPSFNVGLISGTYRLDEARAGSAYTGTVLETTAAVNVGIEGGPLLDAAGRMIGMLTLNYSPHRFLGTAIPIDVLKRPIELMKEGRHSSQVTGQPEAAAGGEGYFGAKVVDRDGRLIVDAVEAGSPAEAAGLRKGIAILSAGARKFKDAAEFEAFVKGLQAGAMLTLNVEDDGLQMEVKILLEKKK